MVNEGFRKYARKQKISELKPWLDDDDMTDVSIGAEAAMAGSPKNGDFIARDPENHSDQWLVAARYFSSYFEPDPVEEG